MNVLFDNLPPHLTTLPIRVVAPAQAPDPRLVDLDASAAIVPSGFADIASARIAAESGCIPAVTGDQLHAISPRLIARHDHLFTCSATGLWLPDGKTLTPMVALPHGDLLRFIESRAAIPSSSDPSVFDASARDLCRMPGISKGIAIIAWVDDEKLTRHIDVRDLETGEKTECPKGIDATWMTPVSISRLRRDTQEHLANVVAAGKGMSVGLVVVPARGVPRRNAGPSPANSSQSTPKAVIGRRTAAGTAGRAPIGGVVGVNGEFYEGGKFLPSRADRPKQPPPKGVEAGSRHRVGPSQWSRAPADWHLSLYSGVAAVLDHAHLQSTGSYRVYRQFLAARCYLDDQQCIDAYIGRLNQGEVWRLSPNAPPGTPEYPRGLSDDQIRKMSIEAWMAADPDFSKPSRAALNRELAARALEIVGDGKGMTIRSGSSSIAIADIYSHDQVLHLESSAPTSQPSTTIRRNI